MIYMVLGYFLASLAFATPYIIRYVRISRREDSGTAVKS